MFGPEATEGCKGCAFLPDHLPDGRHLALKDIGLCVVPRGPIESITAYKAKNGWTFPWYSSAGSDFNYDFYATLDEEVGPMEYNFMGKGELLAKGLAVNTKGEQPGVSVFIRGEDGAVYCTYSAYAVGLDKLLGIFMLLDMTPLGRQVGPGGPGEFKRSYECEAEAGVQK